MGRLATACVLATCLLACTDAPPPPPSMPDGVGLKAIRERGTLRLLTRNNGITYFVLRGQRMGFDYEMAERFAKTLGVQLEVIVPANWGDLIPMLQAGEGDIIGAGIAVTPERQQKITFAKPYALSTVRIAWGPGGTPVESALDLSGKQVHARESSNYYRVLKNLSELFVAAGKEPIDIVIEVGTMETEDILKDVARGKIPYTLCDQHICNESRALHPKLVMGPAITDPHAIGWAVHQQAIELLAAIDTFFESERSGGFQQTYSHYYERSTRLGRTRRDKTYLSENNRISKFDELFKKHGQAHGVDWRLLAAQAFQESEFDPDARTWSGGRGLFGMLPERARELGVKNLADVDQATEAAAKALAELRAGKYAQIPDDADKMRFVLAGYHAGVDHITDARVLASSQGGNAAKWEDVAQALPLLSRTEFAKQAAHGFHRGAETVAYVQETWERYRGYRHALGERDLPALK